MSTAPLLLSVNGLSKSYGGVHAVREVSFALKAGEILALIVEHAAEVVVRIREFRTARDRSAVRRDRRCRVGRFEVQPALVVLGRRGGAAAGEARGSGLETEKIAHVKTVTTASDNQPATLGVVGWARGRRAGNYP